MNTWARVRSTPVTTGMPGVGGPEVNALPVSVIVFSLSS